jgi:hypothetical protein
VLRLFGFAKLVMKKTRVLVMGRELGKVARSVIHHVHQKGLKFCHIRGLPGYQRYYLEVTCIWYSSHRAHLIFLYLSILKDKFGFSQLLLYH